MGVWWYCHGSSVNLAVLWWYLEPGPLRTQGAVVTLVMWVVVVVLEVSVMKVCELSKRPAGVSDSTWLWNKYEHQSMRKSNNQKPGHFCTDETKDVEDKTQDVSLGENIYVFIYIWYYYYLLQIFWLIKLRSKLLHHFRVILWILFT